MKNTPIFDYPNYLNKIFDKLKNNGIKSIIVGGYVRDFFLNIDSKDIDIELLGVNSYQELSNILKEFGRVNNVGKSFGVCKLSLENLEIDFTLPRTDNKIASGHSGFLVKTDKNLDFKTASSRRDFTMNSIGYDVDKEIFIDPFDGIQDIKYKLIKAVNLEKFDEDPLRVFRAVSFRSRLEFNLDEKLFVLCKNMCEKDLLFELAKERVYDEIKKIFLKSPRPSSAFVLLKKTGWTQIFTAS
ncbi:MAG: nucleotidyltransferase [Sulfurimonas sp.]|nr:nucleotidyltransferase [Sulfurimonas sp.]